MPRVNWDCKRVLVPGTIITPLPPLELHFIYVTFIVPGFPLPFIAKQWQSQTIFPNPKIKQKPHELKYNQINGVCVLFQHLISCKYCISPRQYLTKTKKSKNLRFGIHNQILTAQNKVPLY